MHVRTSCHTKFSAARLNAANLSREEADVVRIGLKQRIKLVEKHLYTLLPAESEKKKTLIISHKSHYTTLVVLNHWTAQQSTASTTAGQLSLPVFRNSSLEALSEQRYAVL